MSSSWTRGCPCKDCNFKTKNSYPLVNYIRNCDYENKRLNQKHAMSWQSWPRPCMYWKEGCNFEIQNGDQVVDHLYHCPYRKQSSKIFRGSKHYWPHYIAMDRKITAMALKSLAEEFPKTNERGKVNELVTLSLLKSKQTFSWGSELSFVFKF